ncbi:hypothetical protein MRB53_034373 [Persea americana]|uniref:Uncharacterized protein n=1 Tax=Persea americana TaxID=3435 RepID=A0ACC2KYI6_PERAE|nr:hypothetical protein MRB53_034373 [Persea americana]
MASSGESASKNRVGVEQDGYEPLLLGHDHRNNNKVFNETEIEHPPYTGTSFIRTLFNGLNALSGVGILSIPCALSEGGWSSLILLLMVAIMCCYTGLLLKRCMDVSPNIRSYSDIGELAFGNKGRVLIAVFMYLELYLVAIEFIILESDNLNKLLPNLSFKVFELTIAGKQGFILIAAFVILPTTWLRSMTLLAYISAGGALASIIVVVSVLWAGTLDGVGFHGKGRLINLSGFPTAVSLYAFCYCGHAVFPTIYTSMKDRSQFSKVSKIKDVTPLLPSLHLKLWNNGSYRLPNVWTRFAISNNIKSSSWFQIYNNRAMCLFIRALLVISTAIVALTVPFFGYLMALIGSFLSSTVSMVLPCLCYLKICRPSRRAKLELLIICVTLAVGVIVTVFGTYTSVRQIVEHL